MGDLGLPDGGMRYNAAFRGLGMGIYSACGRHESLGDTRTTGWLEDPEGVPREQPRQSYASHKMDVRREPAGGKSRIYRGWRERAGADGTLGDLERKGESLAWVWGLGVFTEDGGLVYVTPQACGSWLKQRRGPTPYSSE